jgi:hypothetical protein
MPITRTAMIDDDGTGTTGTIINNAWKQELYNQIDAFGEPGWITVPFASGNFTASAGAWTVSAANVGHQKYRRDGTIVDVAIEVNASSISGAPTNIAIQGFPFNFAACPSVLAMSSGSVGGWGVVSCTASGSSLSFNRFDFGPFPVSSGNMYLYLMGRFILP